MTKHPAPNKKNTDAWRDSRDSANAATIASSPALKNGALLTRDKDTEAIVPDENKSE